MGGFLAGLRMQAWLIRRRPDSLLTLCTIPFTAVILLSVVLQAHRPDLVTNALLAPALVGLWAFSITITTDMIEGERWASTMEPAMATRAVLHSVFLGRVTIVIGLGFIPLVETWLLSRLLFGVTVIIHHPVVFVAAMVTSLLATAGTSLLLAAAMLLSRNGSVYGNFLTFPIYILSGVMVPVSYLPGFIQPLSRLIFLSWSAGLLRDSLRQGAVPDVGWRLSAIAMLGAAGLVGGRLLFAAVLRRARDIGTLTYA